MDARDYANTTLFIRLACAGWHVGIDVGQNYNDNNNSKLVPPLIQAVM